MLLRPYSLKQINKSMSTLSPKDLKKPAYLRFKKNREKSSKGGRSLCSIQTNRQSSSLTNKRMLSHRKLISVSSLQHRQNLTERGNSSQTQRQKKCTVQNLHNVGQKNKEFQQRQLSMKKRFHLNKFSRNDRLRTINNEETDNIEKVLQIKENILKEFIDRFQQELKQISQQKSTRQTLSTHRMKAQNTHRLKTQNAKQQTTKKPKNIITSLQSNGSTLNMSKCSYGKQNLPLDVQDIQKSKFKQYIDQIKDHKRKDQKIFIMKNHKKSMQNITISKIGETENITSRISKIQTKSKLNLKQLFRHSKKYEPYLKDSATIVVNSHKFEEIQQKQSSFQRSTLITSPIQKKYFHNIKQTEQQIDCSQIQQMNQSSFISEVGRKSLLKHLESQTIKIMKEQQKKSKKCLAKMKSAFPSDFF